MNSTWNEIVDEAKCFRMRIIGVYCIILFIVSLVFNSSLLAVFYFHKQMRTLYNIFIIAITVINLSTTIITLPLDIISNLYCQWTFGQIGCTINAMMMFWMASTNIYLLTALSHNRFRTVTNQIMGIVNSTNLRNVFLTIASCGLLGLIWALIPVFGWSYYSLTGLGTGCALPWSEKNLNVLSFNVIIFITVFLIPLVLIIFINYKLIRIIKEYYRNQRDYMNMTTIKKKISIEKSLLVVTLSLISSLVIIWLPYVIVSFYKVAIGENKTDPMVDTIFGMMAKLSLVWNALLYICINKKIRKKLLKCVTCQENKRTGSHIRFHIDIQFSKDLRFLKGRIRNYPDFHTFQHGKMLRTSLSSHRTV